MKYFLGLNFCRATNDIRYNSEVTDCCEKTICYHVYIEDEKGFGGNRKEINS